MTVLMNEPAQNSVLGWFLYFIGWAVCVASIFFAVNNKSSSPPYVVQFWVSFSVLVGISTLYLVERRTCEHWKSEEVRLYFCPYIVGATIWVVLFVSFFILDVIVNR